jgi:hypothetical protein
VTSLQIDNIKAAKVNKVNFSPAGAKHVFGSYHQQRMFFFIFKWGKGGGENKKDFCNLAQQASEFSLQYLLIQMKYR